jgi:three-Cys-motif partner protein
MGRNYRNKFFLKKRPWSLYKDTILDYYLDPYLQKVKKIGKPITVVDMFAGRGEFESGEPGSPLIIARRLKSLADQGHEVHLRCYENHRPFFIHLTGTLKPYHFASAVHANCFDHVDEIAGQAAAHTTLLYVDPCDVSQLDLAKLGRVYEKVRQRSSVEALVIFVAEAFMRHAAAANAVKKQLDGSGAMLDSLIRDADEEEKVFWLEALYGEEKTWHLQSQRARLILNSIAGGEYWEPILATPNLDWLEKLEMLVERYRRQLQQWFNVTEALPIYPDTSSIPKYWMIFLSRYAPAFDLFNWAACKTVRMQRQNYRQDGLFAGTRPQPEVAVPATVDREVKRAVIRNGARPWQELRWRTCGDRNVGKFTESEVNQSIKRLLKAGWLQGASGENVQDEALLAPTSQLLSWNDHS